MAAPKGVAAREAAVLTVVVAMALEVAVAVEEMMMMIITRGMDRRTMP